MSLSCISLATLPAGGEVPSQADFQLPPLSPRPLPFHMTDWWPLQVLPECTHNRGQPHGARWIDFHRVPIWARPIQVISITDLPSASPIPQRNFSLLGHLLFWINITPPAGRCSFPSGLGIMHLCHFYIVFVFLANGLLLIIGWHGGERKDITLGACSAW